MKRALLLVLLTACGGGPHRGSAPPSAAHALAIDPPFETLRYDGWAGVSQYTDLVLYGWSTDSKTFVSAHPDLDHLTRDDGVCELIDAASGERVVKDCPGHVDGGPAAQREANFESVGAPAPPGLWRRDDVLTWTVQKTGDVPDQLDFSLRAPTGNETHLATFDALPNMGVYPEAALLSPDGNYLAIVVDQVGGPPLTTDVKIVAL